MKKILIGLIALLAFLQTHSQSVGNDTTKYVYYKFVYGSALDRYWAKKVAMIPADTIYSKDGIALKNGVFYVGNGVKWSQVTGGAGGSDSAVLAGLGLKKTIIGTSVYLTLDTTLATGTHAWEPFYSDSTKKYATPKQIHDSLVALPIDTFHLQNDGSGIRQASSANDSLHIATLVSGRGLNIQKLGDSSVRHSIDTTQQLNWLLPPILSSLSVGSRVMIDPTTGALTTQAEVLHSPATVATAAALPANTYSNGTAGVGATLTATGNGALTVDGVAVIATNRILVKNEAAPANNGLYLVTQAGGVSTPYILTRGNYSSIAANLAAGSQVFIQSGTVNAGLTFYQTTTGAITIGTTALSYVATQVANNSVTLAKEAIGTANTLRVWDGSGNAAAAVVDAPLQLIGGHLKDTSTTSGGTSASAGYGILPVSAGVINVDTLTVDARYPRIFNAKRYGYVADGVTDVTAAIQATIDACHAAGGGHCYFPGGNTWARVHGALLSGVHGNSQIHINFDNPSTTSLNSATFLDGEFASGIPGGGYNKNVAASPMPTNGTIWRSDIVGSGAFPSVLKMDTASSIPLNYTDLHIKNITIEVSTQGGTAPPTLSAFFLKNASQYDIDHCVASLDTFNQVSKDPSGTSTCGFCLSNQNNGGPSRIAFSQSMGFEHGYVVEGEHTIIDHCYAYASIFGLTVTKTGYLLEGKFTPHACRYSIYSPTYTIFGNMAPGLSMLNLHVDEEKDYYFAPGTGTPWWYNNVFSYADTANQLMGVVDHVATDSSTTHAAITKFNTGWLGIHQPYKDTWLTRHHITTPGGTTSLGSAIFNGLTIDGAGAGGYNGVEIDNDLGRSNSIQLLMNGSTKAPYANLGQLWTLLTGGNLSLGTVNTFPLFNMFDAANVNISDIAPGANPTNTNPSALLSLISTTKGFLGPKMTTTQKNAISSPATGLIVYDTTLGEYDWYNGAAWVALGGSGSGGGTAAGSSYDIQFKNANGGFSTAPSSLLHYDSTNARVGIGTASPAAKLEVSGSAAAGGIFDRVTNTNAAANSVAELQVSNNLGNLIELGKESSGSGAGDFGANAGYLYNATGPLSIITNGGNVNLSPDAGSHNPIQVVTGNRINFNNVPNGSGTPNIFVRGSGADSGVYQMPYPSAGTTPTLQQVLTAGSTTTGNNTITNTGNTLSFTGGFYKFNGLPNGSGTPNVLVKGATDSILYQMPYPTFAGFGPAGSAGDIQIVNSGAGAGFATAPSSLFHYDSTNKRLGLGTASPAVILDAQGNSAGGAIIIRATNSNAAASSFAGFEATNNSGNKLQLGILSSGSGGGIFGANIAYITNTSSGNGTTIAALNGPINFSANSSTVGLGLNSSNKIVANGLTQDVGTYDIVTKSANADSGFRRVTVSTLATALGISSSTNKFTQTADATVSNTVTTTTIIGTGVGSLTLGANTIAAGQTVTMRGIGYLSTASSAPLVQFIFSNGAFAANSTPTVAANLVSAPTEYEFTMTCQSTGSSGVVELDGWVSVNGTKTYMTPATYSSFNTTASNTFNFSVNLGTASVNNAITTKTFRLTLN